MFFWCDFEPLLSAETQCGVFWRKSTKFAGKHQLTCLGEVEEVSSKILPKDYKFFPGTKRPIPRS